MNNQAGSIILILLIVITLTSITSIMVLQSSLSFKNQINLSILQAKAKEITTTEIANQSVNIASGIDLNLLPTNQTSNHPFKNHNYTTSKIINTDSILNSALNGYSFNSSYKTQIISLQTNTISSMVNSGNVFNGFGCFLAADEALPSQIESIYSLDLDQDSNNDISYQLDSTSGKISRVDTTTQLLIQFDLDSGQKFSRPAIAIFEFGNRSKLGLAFIVQNTGATAQNANNMLYLIFDNGQFDSQIELPIGTAELADLNTDPEFSVTDKGYYLSLDQGQLVSSAITIFDQQIIFITQRPSTDPDSGFTEYLNKLVTINFQYGSIINPSIQTMGSSTELLNLKLNTENHQSISLNSQFESLLTLSGECRPLYQYEN